ncbi:OPT/YSL family transporter [Lichenicoccus roseus]|uniref:OPT family oligopeptide transporter n=1 Tax=Lichenicoccus roseus TaxID=2683649 RepID=A0A5R9J801_9PROT|nr:OPT/YSL family transporter [Lichenicoccus roseus]TLU72647.1 OPT family oligopeptide transporter [Lichenicoccus roseus]
MDGISRRRDGEAAHVAGEAHPRFFSIGNLLLITPLCVLGSVIGMQVLIRLGVTTNTALIGALAGMALGRIGLPGFRFYRNIHVQNLAQSAISASTFGAANSLLLPIGVPFALGRGDLVLPMFVGAACAMLLDATLLYWMFGSRVFPAEGAWPPGVAAAGAIQAGDEGGRKARVLGIGLGLGIAGSLAGIPMSAFGVAFIANAWALLMFGIGLLLRGYFHLIGPLLHLPDIGKTHVPQGLMLGAGLMALLQVLWTLFAGRHEKDAAEDGRAEAPLQRALGIGACGYVLIAMLIAGLGGLASSMSLWALLGFVVYAAFAALLHELIIGLAAMHSGWFPAFAVAVVTLAVGVLIGFPAPALALLVGFSASTGPAFADMGCDLKAGFLLRGEGRDAAFELDGRRQQYFAAMYAFIIAGIVVLLSYHHYFAHNQVAPVDHVFVAAIRAGRSGDIARELALWAIPGALLQAIGGSRRQMGVMFATGMLLVSPLAGWAVLAGLLCRAAWMRWKGEAGRGDMQIFAAGSIAGDALFSFGRSVLKL